MTKRYENQDIELSRQRDNQDNPMEGTAFRTIAA